MDNEIIDLAARLVHRLSTSGKKLALAESCTGGWIAQALTAIPGSSRCFDRGFVTYSNNAKVQMLDVKSATLDAYGAVSAETVSEMLQGALHFSEADCAIAVSGIAGPCGGSPEKPVGTVYLGWSGTGQREIVQRYHFSGDRQAVRRQAVLHALVAAAQVFCD